MSKTYAFFFMIILCLLSCSKIQKPVSRTIIIQPYDNFSSKLTKITFERIKIIHPNIAVSEPKALPPSAYSKPRSRYRADSIIHILNKEKYDNTIVIGFTNNDISTSKNGIKDWGIMGLSYCPGKASVVSTYRLNKSRLSEQFYKIALHELGHAEGLAHCKMKECLMRDAGGTNITDKIKYFCGFCKSHLSKRGWKL